MTDKRPEVEIQVGAALNAIEPLESEIDDLLVAVIDDPEISREFVRELVWARHHVFVVRGRAAWMFARVTQEPLWLERRATLNGGHVALKDASKHGELLLICVAAAKEMLDTIMRKRTTPREHAVRLQSIIRRTSELPTRVADVDRALTVASLAASP